MDWVHLLIGLALVLLFVAIILLFSYLIREENKKEQLHNRIDKDIRDMAIKMRQERDRYLVEGKNGTF